MKGRMLGLMLGFLFIGANLYAADGDLIVNGNVGIGTTNPSGRLYIVSPSGTNALIGLDAAGTNNAGVVMKVNGVYRGAVFATTGANDGLVLKTGDDAGPLSLATSHTSRILITSTGSVGIGKQPSSEYQLELSSSKAGKPSTSVWDVTSDARIKTNIQPYTKGLNEILQINPVSYKYNGKGGIGRYKIKKTDPLTGEDVLTDFVDTELLSKTNVGVVAQDIQAVVPEAVSSHKGKLNEGDTEETDLLDFNAHPLTFIMINAIKDLKAEIDSLNQQIADLKAKVK